MRTNKKALTILLAVIITPFVVFGIAVCYLTLVTPSKSASSFNEIEIRATCLSVDQPACMNVDPQTDEFLADMAKWQTYRSEILNFEIKYPGDSNEGSGFDSGDCEGRLGHFLSIIPYRYKYDRYSSSPQYEIDAYPSGQKMNEEELVACMTKSFRAADAAVPKIDKHENIVIGAQSVSATKITLSDSNTITVIPGSENTIAIAFFYRPDDPSTKTEEVEKILSTFKFTNGEFVGQSIKNFYISEPPYGGYGAYDKGSKAITYTDDNVARVEFRQRGSGAGNYSDSEGFLVGLGEKTIDADGKARWEMLMPSNGKCWFDPLCVLAYDGQGQKTGEICLQDINDDEGESHYYHNESFDYGKNCKNIGSQ